MLQYLIQSFKSLQEIALNILEVRYTQPMFQGFSVRLGLQAKNWFQNN